MNLDKYLISEIFKYLNISERIKFCTLYDNTFLEEYLIKYRVFKSMRDYSSYKYFNNTNFNKKIIYKLPILEYQSDFSLGDYIDNIKKKYLEYPVMIGVDLWQRPFIAMKFDNHKNGHQGNRCITVFQRYSNDNNNWTFGGIAGPPPNAIDLENISRIQQLPKKLYRHIVENAVFETD